jgi:adenylyltransferase/sulfurtransferase
LTDEEKKILNVKEREFYSRQIMLRDIGYNGQIKLKKAKACIIGLGGLGSSIAKQLTAMGVGYIRLVDRDIVEISNLQRQHLYDTKVLGYSKAEIAAQRLRDLNPYINFEPLPLSINSDNAESLVRNMDVIIDGLDAMTPRYAINKACIKLGVPYVFGAAVMIYGNVSTIIPNETPCLECFYGNVNEDSIQKCAVVGVHPSIIKIIASIEVSEAVRILLKQKPVLKSKLLHCSLSDLSIDIIDIVKTEKCPICSINTSKKAFIKRKLVEEVCGREGNKTFIIVPKEDLKLNIVKLAKMFEKKNFRSEKKGRFTIKISKGEKKINLLKSGIMICKGFKNKDTALSMTKNILTDIPGVSWSRVE